MIKRVNFHKRTVCFLLLLTAMIFMAVGCSIGKEAEREQTEKTDKKMTDAIPISIKVDEDYAISDIDDLTASFQNTYKSEDSSVAVLRDGKYILGLRAGSTVITVNDGEKDTVYDVTVTVGEKAESRSVQTMVENEGQENKIKIGYGYNATKGEELNITTVTKPVFDWNKVLESGELYTDGSEQTITECYNGSKISEFVDSYSEKSTVNVSVKLFGKKILEKEKITEKLQLKQEKSMKQMNQLYHQIVKRTYDFMGDDDGYVNFVLPEVQEKLMGTDRNKTTVKQFIEEYGTHVLVSGLYGGSFEFSYILSDSNKSPLCSDTYCYLLYSFIYQYQIANHLNIDLSREYVMNHPDVINQALLHFQNRSLSEEDAFDIWKDLDKNYEHNTSRRYIGGNRRWYNNKFEFGRTLDQAIYEYSFWLEDVDDSALIGPRNKYSLYPVWELIPTDTEEGRKRIEEFEEYLKSVS